MAEPHSPTSTTDVYTLLGLSHNHTSHNRASDILDHHSENKHSKPSSILDITKAYKFFTLKWHHDHSHGHNKLEVNHATHDAAKNHERVSSGDDATTSWEANDSPFNEHHNVGSMDDGFIHHRSSSSLSKSASRRSHTPTPSSLSRTSSRRSNSVADFFSLGSLSRSASRKPGHSPSESVDATSSATVNASPSQSSSSKTFARMTSSAGRGPSEGLTNPNKKSRSVSTSRMPTRSMSRTKSRSKIGGSPEKERAKSSRSTSTGGRIQERTMSRTKSSLGRDGSSPEIGRKITRTMSRKASSVKRGSCVKPSEPSEASEKATKTMSRTASNTKKRSTSVTPPERATTPISSSSSSRSTSRGKTTPVRSMSRTASRIVYSQTAAKKKPPPIEMKLKCTLEEMLTGCIKVVTITRDVLSEEAGVIKEEDKLKINVHPGWRKGTKIMFEGKGDEKPGYLPADIVFVIDEKKHPLFKRRGDDLETSVEIPLVQALTGCKLTVPLLGGEETMSLTLEDIIYPGFEKAIPGQGMPCTKDPSRRGELRITFYVDFPLRMAEEQRHEAYEILSKCEFPSP